MSASKVSVEGGTGDGVVLRATSTLRAEVAVSGQTLLAAVGQILLCAHKHPHVL